MNAPTLAEIIEEGKRRHAEHDAATMIRSLRTAEALVCFYAERASRILAVAEDAGRFRESAEEWLKLLDDPDKVDEAAWTRMNNAREKLFAHFALKPTDDDARGEE